MPCVYSRVYSEFPPLHSLVYLMTSTSQCVSRLPGSVPITISGWLRSLMTSARTHGAIFSKSHNALSISGAIKSQSFNKRQNRYCRILILEREFPILFDAKGCEILSISEQICSQVNPNSDNVLENFLNLMLNPCFSRVFHTDSFGDSLRFRSCRVLMTLKWQ